MGGKSRGLMAASSMVGGDLDLVGIVVLPNETNAPLVVDTNAVLTFAVFLQRFQMVRWWHA